MSPKCHYVVCIYCLLDAEPRLINSIVMHRHASEVMGFSSVYTQLLAIIQTFKHLQLTFNEFVLLRCEALLNAGWYGFYSIKFNCSRNKNLPLASKSLLQACHQPFSQGMLQTRLTVNYSHENSELLRCQKPLTI